MGQTINQLEATRGHNGIPLTILRLISEFIQMEPKGGTRPGLASLCTRMKFLFTKGVGPLEGYVLMKRNFMLLKSQLNG